MARRQITLAGTGFEKYTKTSRRAQFLAECAPLRADLLVVGPGWSMAELHDHIRRGSRLGIEVWRYFRFPVR